MRGRIAKIDHSLAKRCGSHVALILLLHGYRGLCRGICEAFEFQSGIENERVDWCSE